MSLPSIRQPPPPEPPKDGLLKRIFGGFSSWFGTKQELEGRAPNTTQTGSTVESPATMEAQLIQLRYDREAIISDVRRLMDSDPRMAQSNQEIARDVFGTGLRVTVRGAEGTPDNLVDVAQDIIDSMFRDTDLNGTGPGWVAGLLEDGELYISPVVQEPRITRIMPLPTATMDPVIDTRGQFIDAMKAFRQIDLQSREELAQFHLWQVNWIRYDYRPTRGDIHGRSQYLQVRGLGQYLHMEENDLVVMRRTRAPLRRQHKLGTPESPAQPHEIEDYKVKNSLDNPDMQRITTDHVTNGKVDIKTLDGQQNLGEIEDVEHIQNAFMGRMGKPKGLMGWGEDINRDVLEQQQEEYQAFLKGLRNLLWNGDGGIFSGIKALCDFALLLAGINPDQVTYQPSWPLKLTKAQLEFVKAVDERRVSGLISHKTALSLVADTLGIESAEAELLLIQQEREERQGFEDDDDRAFAARQTGSPNRNQTALRGADDDDDDDGEPRGASQLQ